MIPKINAAPYLGYVKSDYKPNLLVRIIIRIIEIVKKIIGFCVFWKGDPYKLDAKQQEALQKIQLKCYLKPMGAPPKNSYTIFKPKKNAGSPRTSDEDDKSVSQECAASEYSGKDFPLPLQNLRRVLSTLMDDVIDGLQEVKVLPFIAKWTEYIQNAMGMVKDLYEKINGFGIQPKVPIFNLISEPNENARKVLDWLIENTKRDDLKLEGDGPHKEAVLQWVFNPLRAEKFHHEFIEHEHPTELIIPIYHQCLKILINNKLELLCQDFKVRLIDNLPRLIHTFLKENSSIIVKELSGRIADLLSHSDISKLIDDLTDAFYHHIKTYTEAKKAVEEELGEKASSTNESEFNATCAKKFATLPDAHPKLKEIITVPKDREADTWQDSKESKIWKRSVEKRFVKQFSEILISALFPMKKIEEDGTIIEIDGIKNLWKRVIIPEEFKSILNEIEAFSLRFLPEDFTIAKDARTLFSNAMNQLVPTLIRDELPSLVSKLFYKAFKALVRPEKLTHVLHTYLAPVIEEQCIDLVTRNIIENDLRKFTDLFSELRTNRNELSKLSKGIKLFVHEKLKNLDENSNAHIDRLTNLIHEDIEIALFSDNPKNQTLETIILSALSRSSTGKRYPHHEIAKNAIRPHWKEISAFLEMFSQKALEHNELEKKIAKKLYHFFMGTINQYKEPITLEAFREFIAKPLVIEFGGVLSNPDFAGDPPEIAIGKYLKASGPDEDKTNKYSEMILNLVFNIGEFGGLGEYAVTALKDQIDLSITNSIARYKKGDYLLFAMIAKKLKEKFSTKEAIIDVFFTEPDKKTTAADLSEKITRISGIVYDLLYQIVPYGAKTIGTIGLGWTSTPLDNTIRRIFNRLFQNELLNADLAFKLMNIIGATVSTANVEINEENAFYMETKDDDAFDVLSRSLFMSSSRVI